MLPSLALMVTVRELVTTDVVTVNAADVLPAGIVTLAGREA